MDKNIKLDDISEYKFIKVMFGNKSNANNFGYEYKIDEINESDIWNPDEKDAAKMGGFNFTTESKVIRWLVRGDTVYDVVIPKDAEVIDCAHPSTPHGVFRSNKIIITNPRAITDELAMEYYLKSDIPEKSYYKAMAGCAIRGHLNTLNKMIEDKVNKENVDIVLSEVLDFYMPEGAAGKNSVELIERLKKIKED